MKAGASQGGAGRNGVRLLVASIFGVLVLFVALQAIGNPDRTLGSAAESVVYSVLVYVPVAVVCIMALLKSRR
jgi:hypothetical protein